jgi:hypothetical protein
MPRRDVSGWNNESRLTQSVAGPILLQLFCPRRGAEYKALLLNCNGSDDARIEKREKEPSFTEAAPYLTSSYRRTRFSKLLVRSRCRKPNAGRADPRPKISFRVTTKPPNKPIGTVSDSYDRKACAGKRPRNGVDRCGYSGNRKSGQCNRRKKYRGSYDPC